MTSLEGNPRELKGHPVYEAAVQLKNRRSLVVIAVLSSGVEGVSNLLDTFRKEGTYIKKVIFAE